MIYEAIDCWHSPELYHHGVKGMKWGIRHDKPRSPRKTRKQKRYERSDYAKAKSLSDNELRQRINRINLEQSYIRAVEQDRSSYREATDSVLMKWGRRYIRTLNNIMLNSGSSMLNFGAQLTKNTATNVANMYAPITKGKKKK